MIMSVSSEELIEQAMTLIACKGWHVFQLSDLCKDGVTPYEVAQFFSHKEDVLHGFSHMISDRLRKSMPTFDEATSPQERLLEVLMLRLEALMPYRVACTCIMESYEKDPLGGISSSLFFQGVTDEMCDLAHVPKSYMFSWAFFGLCGWTLWEWRHDDTPDLSKTMAFINHRLGYLFQYL